MALAGDRPTAPSARQRGQGNAGSQAWHCFQKPYRLVGTQNLRQLPGLPGVRNPLRYLVTPQRDAPEKPQRANHMIQPRPRDPFGNQVHLKRPNILQSEPIRRPAKKD
jgi:hypothetical protein